MVWIWQALYGRHLRWCGKNKKTEQKNRKSQSRSGSLFWTPFWTSKWDLFGAEITCDNDFGGAQVVKKRGLETSTEKDPIPPRDRLEPQPREGGRGKGKPSQLEDWKSLKPKPPQPRGLVGLVRMEIRCSFWQWILVGDMKSS